MATGEWFIYQSSAPPVGPLSSEQVLERLVNGELSEQSWLCPVEGGSWEKLETLRPTLQARTTPPSPQPWFIFREGRPPLGPLSSELLHRGIDAGKVPPDALLARAGGLAWYSRARALQEDAEPSPEEMRHETTALRTAVVSPTPVAATPTPAAPAAPAPAAAGLSGVARERAILAGFAAATLALAALLALLARSSPAENARPAAAPRAVASTPVGPATGSGASSAPSAPDHREAPEMGVMAPPRSQASH